MKKNILMAALMLAVAVLAVLVVIQRGQIAQLRDASAVTAEKPRMQPVREAERPTLSETKPKEPVASAVPATAPATQADATAGTTSNYFSGLAKMMKNPQMKEMVRSQQKIMLDRQYGSLSKYLNLPAERLDALKALLSDRQMAMVDAGMSMMGGSESERKQALEDSKVIKADYDKKIQDLLGSQDYPVFQDYEKTLNERTSVQMFKESLPTSDALSDQQEDNLIAMMYQERKDMPVSSLMNNQNQDPSQLTEERIAELQKQLSDLQQKYAEQAKGILTPAQLERFTGWQQQWTTMQLAGLKMAAAMFGNKGATPTPPATPSKAP